MHPGLKLLPQKFQQCGQLNLGQIALAHIGKQGLGGIQIGHLGLIQIQQGQAMRSSRFQLLSRAVAQSFEAGVPGHPAMYLVPLHFCGGMAQVVLDHRLPMSPVGAGVEHPEHNLPLQLPANIHADFGWIQHSFHRQPRHPG